MRDLITAAGISLDNTAALEMIGDADLRTLTPESHEVRVALALHRS